MSLHGVALLSTATAPGLDFAFAMFQLSRVEDLYKLPSSAIADVLFCPALSNARLDSYLQLSSGYIKVEKQKVMSFKLRAFELLNTLQ